MKIFDVAVILFYAIVLLFMSFSCLYSASSTFDIYAFSFGSAISLMLLAYGLFHALKLFIKKGGK